MSQYGEQFGQGSVPGPVNPPQGGAAPQQWPAQQGFPGQAFPNPVQETPGQPQVPAAAPSAQDPFLQPPQFGQPGQPDPFQQFLEQQAPQGVEAVAAPADSFPQQPAQPAFPQEPQAQLAQQFGLEQPQQAAPQPEQPAAPAQQFEQPAQQVPNVAPQHMQQPVANEEPAVYVPPAAEAPAPNPAQRFPLPTQTRVFAVSNQKGGVGKTTSTVNLAVALAQAGARVLVIDLDPQGNASTALGVDHRAEVSSVYNVLIDSTPLAEVVQTSAEAPNLFVVPATIHLAGAEIELVSLVAREQRLRTALARYLSEVPGGFHYVFIDCPPSLGLLAINALVAANEVLIPIQCEYYALEGLSQLLATIEQVKVHLNPSLRLSTILLTMFDSRTKLASQVADEVRTHFPRETLSTIIPRSVRVSEAPSYGQTVITYDNGSIGSLSYQEAGAEIAQRGTAR